MVNLFLTEGCVDNMKNYTKWICNEGANGHIRRVCCNALFFSYASVLCGLGVRRCELIAFRTHFELCDSFVTLCKVLNFTGC